MSQQIINIPINWDDDAIKTCIEKGVIEEVISRVRKSLVSTKDYKEAKKELLTEKGEVK